MNEFQSWVKKRKTPEPKSEVKIEVYQEEDELYSAWIDFWREWKFMFYFGLAMLIFLSIISILYGASVYRIQNEFYKSEEYRLWKGK